jgi:hypothetical protein
LLLVDLVQSLLLLQWMHLEPCEEMLQAPLLLGLDLLLLEDLLLLVLDKEVKPQ